MLTKLISGIGKALGGPGGDGGFGVSSLIHSLNSDLGAPRRGTAELLAAYKNSPALRAVVSKIAINIASTDWFLIQPAEGSSKTVRHQVRKALRQKDHAVIKQMEDEGEIDIIRQHPLLSFLRFGNPILNGNQCLKLSQIYLDLKGDSIWLIERDESGMPVEYFPIPPHWVQSTPKGDARTFTISWQGRPMEVKAEDLLWLRDPDPTNPYGNGTGYGEALGDELDTDEYASKLIKTTFLNRGRPDMLVAVEGAEQSDLNELSARVQNSHRGFWNSGKMLFFEGGRVSFKEVNQDFVQLQMLDIRTWEKNIITETFGVPPELLGRVENSNRATIENSQRIFADSVLTPRLEFLAAAFNERLLPQFPDTEGLILSFEDPTPDDFERRLDTMKAQPGAFTVAEWRAMAGFPSREGDSEIHLVDDTILGVEEVPEEKKVDGFTKRVIPVTKALTAQEIEEVVALITPDALEQFMLPNIQTELETELLVELAKFGIKGDAAFRIVNPLVLRYAEQLSGQRITSINGTTQDAVRQQLLRGVELGEGTEKLAARVRTVFSQSKGFRSEMIARTEVVSAANWGKLEAGKAAEVALNVRLQKEYIATADGRVRDDHIAVDGDVKNLSDEFVYPDGVTTMAPGQSGVSHQDINCRCTLATFEPRVERALGIPETRAKIWKAFDEASREWEKTLRPNVQRAFNQQEDVVRRALANRL